LVYRLPYHIHLHSKKVEAPVALPKVLRPGLKSQPTKTGAFSKYTNTAARKVRKATENFKVQDFFAVKNRFGDVFR
jgi:hypothetical protein